MTSLDSSTPRSGAAELRLVELCDEPIDVAAVLAAVGDPAAGGVNLFVGVVRNHDVGRAVTQLEYSAHPSALDRLREVAAGVAGEFEVTAVAAVHRIGTLGIGDVAVVVAVSARHRAEAYVASRALIDRLKEQVPVWKHQTFGDGTDEWVNSL